MPQNLEEKERKKRELVVATANNFPDSFSPSFSVRSALTSPPSPPPPTRDYNSLETFHFHPTAKHISLIIMGDEVDDAQVLGCPSARPFRQPRKKTRLRAEKPLLCEFAYYEVQNSRAKLASWLAQKKNEHTQ